ncbi:hypothetical protein HPB49_021448 [Dermacentor silvarum]|uniref:Uncharacterized protein n=1 Tax=Dermacentor silvarum TaxID=543639 RepID=A0ACB8DRT7_DERSI|nr:hypothetical protein HPB49_021448 [Dermacentor silvarum]
MSQLARPQFHGLLKNHLRKHIAICLTLGAVGGVAWRYLVVNRRRQLYADFYKGSTAVAIDSCRRGHSTV